MIAIKEIQKIIDSLEEQLKSDRLTMVERLLIEAKLNQAIYELSLSL